MQNLAQLWESYGRENLPEPIAEKVLELQSSHLNTRIVPFLYVTLVFGIVSVALAQESNAPMLTRIILPTIVATGAIVRTIRWYILRSKAFDPEKAAQSIRNMAITSFLFGSLCGLWSFITWHSDSSNLRHYIPAFMAMGSFATAYCLALMPQVAIRNLAIGVVPISCALLMSGVQINIALGITIIASMFFLISLIHKQYRQTVQMIDMQIQMHDMAHTDSLTGLLNRRAFHRAFKNSLSSSTQDRPVTLAMFDLDEFKSVNDNHGHLTGDKLLHEVARRMYSYLGEFGQVARLGGDEFAVLFDGHSPIFCNQLITRFMTGLSEPFDINGNMLSLDASYGIVSSSEAGGDNMLILMADVDQLLYKMKKQKNSRARETGNTTKMDKGRNAA